MAKIRFATEAEIPEKLRPVMVGDDQNGWEVDSEVDEALTSGLRQNRDRWAQEANRLKGVLPDDMTAEDIAKMREENERLKAAGDDTSLRDELLTTRQQSESYRGQALEARAERQLLEEALAVGAHPDIVGKLLRQGRVCGVEGDDGIFRVEVLNGRGEVDTFIDDNGESVPRSMSDLFGQVRKESGYGIYFAAPERNGAETPPSNQRGAPQRKYTQEQAAELDQAEYDKAREEGLIEGL